ncbi:MAG: S9 family peptidase [Cardiobacteriaceae bacterium]|nr:S9 family peptidase [Cardiobacteriaceae bacterium]
MKLKPLIFTLMLTMTTAYSQTPPDIEKHPHNVPSPYGERQDEYYWLRDDERKNPEMLAYLKAENAYADAVMQPLKPLEDKLYNEILSRIKQDDSTVPSRDRGYWYYTRFEEGQDYPIYARRAAQDGIDAISIQTANQKGDFAGEEILINVNTLAKGHDYYKAAPVDISMDNQRMVWLEDTNGRRQYTLYFTDLNTGKALLDKISGTNGNAVWADDGKTLFYIENDPETLLSKRIKKHILGTDSKDDQVVYEEADDSFYLGLGRSRDDAYLLIHSSSTVSDEVRYTDAKQPDTFKVLSPRERNLEYSADHFDGQWFIRTNANGATNFKIVTAQDNATDHTHWKDWIAHDPTIYIDGFELFNNFTAISERSEGLERIRILKKNGNSEYVKADESAYSMGLGSNPEANSDWLRYSYTSMTTPDIVYEINTQNGERRELKQQPVPSYDQHHYITERLWVPARDGTKIPVSLVYRKDFKHDGTAALLQYGYGSYGASMDPYFSSSVVSLLDRGMVYAIAHIRGGQEMGRQWYENGKMFNKKNTFTDFIDVTRYLVAEKYAAKDRVAALGGSAGGLLMGAIANMAPEDYRVILSQVPFVDVVTTMLDPSIPLTTNEYDEWGNPETSKESYEYMLSYSPYDNLKTQAYPAMFIGTGLWDSQVQYWEPTKYVARLRDLNTGHYPIIFRINMEAGHGGKSGRFQRFRETAEMYAFMLEQLGVK